MAKPVVKGHAVASLIIGALECVFALIIIICSFVLVGKADMPGSLTPYWAGIPLAIPGILGIVVGITKHHCSMVGFLIFNIISFIIEIVALILIVIVVRYWEGYGEGLCNMVATSTCRCESTFGGWKTFTGIERCDQIRDISLLLYVLITFIVLAAILSLAGSIIGFVHLCSERKEPMKGTVIMNPQQEIYPPFQQ